CRRLRPHPFGPAGPARAADVAAVPARPAGAVARGWDDGQAHGWQPVGFAQPTINLRSVTIAHAVAEEPVLHMEPLLTSGKLAMWIFLATEIMFFTGLIGTYAVLRNGMPTSREPWPRPHDVHLVEFWGAFNTLVLIASSLTVVLAHYALVRGDAKKATLYVGVTFALGTVFMIVKAYQYHAKCEPHILRGHVFDKLDGPRGAEYVTTVRREVVEHLEKHPDNAEFKRLLDDIDGTGGRVALGPAAVGERVKALLHADEN